MNWVNLPEGIQDQESFNCDIVKKLGLIYILSGYLFTHAAIQFQGSITSYEMEEETCFLASQECLNLGEQTLILLLISFNHVYEGAVQSG